MTQKTITIFYSWQSDLPRKTNASLIRNALHQAKDQLEENTDINIVIDEATRNECGSPDIIETILRKIDNCDFYIADVSIINNNDNATKKTPNPNVLFECGYALNALGWERVTLLLNNYFGELESLPFDLNRRRISTYTANSESTNKDLANNQIYSLVYDILSSWIREIDALDPVARRNNIEFIKNQRDVKNLKKFFSCFDVFSIQQLCKEDLPEYINSKIYFDYAINIQYQISTLDFHIYNPKLNKLIKRFSDLYLAIFSYGPYYEPFGRYNDQFKFKNPNGDLEEIFNKIKETSQKLLKTLYKILHIMRNTDHFIEVDIDALGNKAWKKAYEEMQKTRQQIDKGREDNCEAAETLSED